MICQPLDHIWVNGAVPTTCGARAVTYCGKCGITSPSQGATYVGVVQTTLDGWSTLRAAENAAQAVLA